MAKTWKETLTDLEESIRGVLQNLGVLDPERRPVPVPVRSNRPRSSQQADRS